MGDQMQGFTGFPAGKLPTTAVPNAFFSELLPLVDHLGELKVLLHLFWLIGKKHGKLRYARLDELLKDRRLLAGLATPRLSGAAALADALERGVARGALLHATVARGAETEEWYMVNSPAGRDLLERLRAGELDVLGDLGEDVQLNVDRPPIFVLYEQNIGMLTPMIAEELRDAEKHFPPEWIVDAFREAAELNKRSWRYILAILERWRREGRGPAAQPSEVQPDNETLLRRYGGARRGDEEW